MCGSRYRRLWLRCASFQIWSEPKIVDRICFTSEKHLWAIISYLVPVDVYPAVYEDVVHLHEHENHVQDGVSSKHQVVAYTPNKFCESILTLGG